jgi:hypothetical protein
MVCVKQPWHCARCTEVGKMTTLSSTGPDTISGRTVQAHYRKYRDTCGKSTEPKSFGDWEKACSNVRSRKREPKAREEPSLERKSKKRRKLVNETTSVRSPALRRGSSARGLCGRVKQKGHHVSGDGPVGGSQMRPAVACHCRACLAPRSVFSDTADGLIHSTFLNQCFLVANQLLK